MKFYIKLLMLLLIVVTAVSCGPIRQLFGINDRVTFYNTYGYEDGDEVVIPMRIYVQRNRPNIERLTRAVTRSLRDVTVQDRANYRHRIRDFLADSQSLEAVWFSFDEDPEQEEFRLRNERGRTIRTGLNGMKEGKIRVPAERIDELFESQDSENGWLTFYAVSSGLEGEGRVQIIEPKGVSVISDIDDTIKVTKIPAGNRVVINNTFFKAFEAAPGMADLYNEWDQAAFHYVSGAPWQMYRPLSQFLLGSAGFPAGSFHMKVVNKNFLSLRTWRGLRQLITNEMLTFEQKIDQISRIINHFPDRQFILVGDSGERDPEIYATIRDWFPDQVKEIYIRDVINDRELNPERLEGMTIIPAPTVTRETGDPIEPVDG